MSELVRFSVTVPDDLLVAFDAYVAKRGVAKNRSEVVRDLIRDALVEDEWSIPGREVVGTLTILFDVSGGGDFQHRLEEVKYDYRDLIVSSMRIFIDNHNCMEVIALRGENDHIAGIADLLLGMKGVKHGQLTTTTTGAFL